MTVHRYNKPLCGLSHRMLHPQGFGMLACGGQSPGWMYQAGLQNKIPTPLRARLRSQLKQNVIWPIEFHALFPRDWHSRTLVTILCYSLVPEGAQRGSGWMNIPIVIVKIELGSLLLVICLFIWLEQCKLMNTHGAHAWLKIYWMFSPWT